MDVRYGRTHKHWDVNHPIQNEMLLQNSWPSHGKVSCTTSQTWNNLMGATNNL